MRKFSNLGRTSAHADAMLMNLSKSIIESKRIFTTLAKGKALRRFIEPILTKIKDDSTHSRRIVFSYFQDKNTVKELFNNVSEKIASRPGGYLRIIKTGNRPGDNASMCMVEFVDYNSLYNLDSNLASVDQKKTRRGKKKFLAATDAEKAEAEATSIATDAKKAEAEATSVGTDVERAEAEKN